MQKLNIKLINAITGEFTCQQLTQEFIAALPTQAQWDAIGALPAKPEPPTVTDAGATPQPDGTGGHVAQYVLSASSTVPEGERHVLACDINAERKELTEIIGGMYEPSHLLDIHAGRSFYRIARNEYGETVSDLASSDNAHTYDGLL